MTDYNIDFNFDNTNTSYLTHSLHPYPAKFPPKLPRTILSKFGSKGQTVLDPFCGSGTTLVEARLLGFNAIGVDVNGLASLLSKVKSTPLNTDEINEVNFYISLVKNESDKWKTNRPAIRVKQISSINHWFQNNVAEELTFLVDLVDTIDKSNVRDFLKIVISSIIVRVSNQESDTRFAAKNKNIPNNFTFQLFILRATEYLERVYAFSNQLDYDSTLKVINTDSRNLNMFADNSIDLIITSPPYANTYDYYLYHKFRKLWLNIDVDYARNNEIGSRREYSSLKKPAEQWTKDLKICFSEMHRLIRKNGLVFIIIGDSIINKQLIKIDDVINDFSQEIGFEVCNIISSNLSEHSKMFNPTFSKKGKKEHLIILKKE